jgi:N-acetylmuramoyl-L-alanine amidase
MMSSFAPHGSCLQRAGLFVAVFLLVTANTASTAFGATNAIVAVDVGHTLQAPGATSARGVPEFRFNSNLASVLRETLMTNRVRVLSIADDGNMRELKMRTATAAAEGANFFLSVHHDSVQPQYLQPWTWQGNAMRYSDQFSGFSLFISRKNSHVESSVRCASTIGASLQQMGFHPSAHHAEHIAGENRDWADESNGVYYYDDLVVLKTATMPAVLLEAGIIVNRNEETLLQEPGTRKSIAEAVTRGLRACRALE